MNVLTKIQKALKILVIALPVGAILVYNENKTHAFALTVATLIATAFCGYLLLKVSILKFNTSKTKG